MDYFKSFEVRILNIYIGSMIGLMKYYDYLCFVWKKIILRQSDCKKNAKFPFAIEDLDPDLKNQWVGDFQGK